MKQYKKNGKKYRKTNDREKPQVKKGRECKMKWKKAK